MGTPPSQTSKRWRSSDQERAILGASEVPNAALQHRSGSAFGLLGGRLAHSRPSISRGRPYDRELPKLPQGFCPRLGPQRGWHRHSGSGAKQGLHRTRATAHPARPPAGPEPQSNCEHEAGETQNSASTRCMPHKLSCRQTPCSDTVVIQGAQLVTQVARQDRARALIGRDTLPWDCGQFVDGTPSSTACALG